MTMSKQRRSFVWFSLCIATACTPPNRAPIKSPPPTTLVATSYTDVCARRVTVNELPESFDIEGKTCVVRKGQAALQDVLIKRTKEQSIQLDLTRADLEIFPPHQPAELAYVRVRSPLQFSGWVHVERYGVVSKTKLADGTILTGKHATLSKAHAAGDALVGEVSIGGAIAEQVRVVCSALTTAPAEAPEPEQVLGGNLVRPVAAWIDLASSIATSKTWRLRNVMALSRLDEKDGKVAVSASYADGSEVTGWAQAGDLEPVPAGEQPVPAGRGVGFCGEGCDGGGGEYQVERARVLANTPVLSAPDGEVWAEVPALLDALIAYKGNEAWVRLLKVEGMEEDRGCHTLQHAWVARERVKLTEQR
jgi:hypothetical protein